MQESEHDVVDRRIEIGRVAENTVRGGRFDGERGDFDALRIHDFDHRRLILRDDDGVAPAAANLDVCAIRDTNVFLVPTAQHANLAARRRQRLDRILDRRELPVTRRAIADDDRATAFQLAERTEARAAIDTEPTTPPSIGSMLQWISASDAMNWRGPNAGASSVKIHGTTSSGVLGRAAMTQ